MRILVTGTAGRVGAATAKELLEHGYSVRGVDKHAPKDDLRTSIENVYVDLTDRIGMLRAAEGCDAIAHLAAIPNPGILDDHIIHTNVVGTQYIFAAAEAHGINRVSIASTCCAFGIFFARHSIDPQYLPMNEAHPDLPQDLYGLSKVLNEETARAYTRRCGMTTTALRLTTVYDLPEAAERHSRWLHHKLGDSEHRQNDLWSYIDLKDCARAFRLSLENAVVGTNSTAIIAARDSFTRLDIRDLIKKHFPQHAEATSQLDPAACLYELDTAEKAFGFIADQTWRNFPEFVQP